MEDKSLFETGQYSQIIKKYNGREDELDVWDLYWLSRSYYKMEKYTECIKTYELYKGLNSGRDNLKNICAWAYYHIMKTRENKESLLKFANYIIDNSEQGDFSPYEFTVDYVVKFLEEEKGAFNKEETYEWLKKLNPNLLSKEPYISEKDGVKRELASKHEKWYASKSKYEFDLGLYVESIETCNLALNNINKFHTDNDVWFKFKISKSLKELGNINEAKDKLEELGKIHKHFAIKSELGDALIKLGEKEDAKKAYYEGLVSKIGTLGNKVKLIENLADVLLEDRNLENAKLNYLLVKKIRDENNWNISPNLTNKINSLKDVNLKIEENEILDSCINNWHKNYYNNLEKAKGKIIFILKNNKGGFIEFEKESIYFNTSELKEIKTKEAINKSVKFFITDGYNKKKKQIQKEAINIEVLGAE